MEITGNDDGFHGPVPDDLVNLVALLNTVGLESGTDDLATWLGPATADEIDAGRRLRTALRALAGHNCGDPLDARALEGVADLPVRVRLVASGSPIVAEGRGATQVIGEAVASHVRAVEQGRWGGVKLCASPSCRWAFWDGSKNGSRKWCAMRRCGSRAKMRAYRARAQTRT